MPLTISNYPADNTFISSIQLPDSGTSILVTGAINPSTLGEISFTGSPVTSPVAPASGFIYWLVEVNTTTGALDMQQSTTSFPANNAGCITIFQQTLAPSNTDPALVSTSVTPNV